MNKIILNFGNIISEMENKNIELCLVKDRNWFLKDSENRLYEIESEKYGSYLDKLIRDKEIVNFNLVDGRYIEDWEKELWNVEKVKDFIQRIVWVEYPEVKERMISK